MSEDKFIIGRKLLAALINNASMARDWAPPNRRKVAQAAGRNYTQALAILRGPPSIAAAAPKPRKAASAAGAALRAIPSEDRAAASRANGKRGGRPRKAAAPGLVVPQPDGNRDANADGVEAQAAALDNVAEAKAARAAGDNVEPPPIGSAWAPWAEPLRPGWVKAEPGALAKALEEPPLTMRQRAQAAAQAAQAIQADANAQGLGAELDGNPPRPRPANQRPPYLDRLTAKYKLGADDVDRLEADYVSRHGQAPQFIADWSELFRSATERPKGA